MLSNNVKARQEDCDGIYTLLTPLDTSLNSQEYFFRQAYRNAEMAGNDDSITANSLTSDTKTDAENTVK